MKVVVGLGNPEARYRNTRHNVGFEVLAELARRHGGGKPKLDFEAETVDILVAGEKTLLVAPQTYMNLSGRAVRKVFDFYKLEPTELVVVCDDMNLDTGRLRMRPQGSAGGQKGLHDIINRIGTEQFARLRVGIGRPPGQMNSSAYVLGKFRGEERGNMDVSIVEAADGIELWIRDGIETAMNRVNAPPPDSKS
jgi:PTH1 family peptidyl-tRNA hydrolase